MLPVHPKLIFVLVALLSGCTEPADSLYPLRDGHWRYYRSQTVILDETRVQRVMIGVVEETGVRDRDAIVVRQSPYHDSFVARTDEGIIRLAKRDRYRNLISWETTPTVLLPATLEADTAWTAPSRLGLIESRTFARQDRLRNRVIPFELTLTVRSMSETVEVPAGQFSNCVLIVGSGTVTVRTDRGNAVAEVSIQQYDWYAPGVGLVKSERREGSESPFLKPGFYQIELLQFGS